jgi:O-antigen/teichoic acid export membrane protein
LPNDDYGKIITVFTLSNSLAVVFNFGLPIYLQRLAAQRNYKIKEVYNTSLFLNLLSFLVYLPSVIFFANLLFGNIEFILVLIIALSVFISFASATPFGYLSGIKKYKLIFSIILFSRIFAIFLLLLVLILNITSTVYFLIPILISGILHFTLQYISSEKELKNIQTSKIQSGNIIKLLKVTMPLYFAVVFNFLYDKIDVLIISKILNYAELSYYSVGYGVFKSSSLAFAFLLVGGLTKASYLSNSKKGIKLFIKKYASIILIITVPIFFILFLFPDIIINILYGKRYENSIFIIKWLSPAIILLGLNNLTGILLNSFGMFKANMIITLIGLLVNIILNILFLNYYGIIISVIATIVTEFLILAGGAIYLINKMKN